MSHDSNHHASVTRLIRGRLRPPVRSWRFWIVQALVLVIFLIHEAGDGRLGFAPTAGVDRVVPFVAFLIPILYAALTFGFWGSVATTTLATLLALFDTWLDASHYSTYELVSIPVQIVIFNVIAVLVAARIESEQAARAAARAAAQGILRAQEDERRRLAQELHDQPVQTLIHLCRGLDAVTDNETLPAAARQQLADARRTAEDVIESLRRTARGLRPPALDDLGLEACVRRLVSDLQERSGIAADLRLPAHMNRMTPEIELAIFRIVQEALSNVERHASAHTVSVSIDVDRGEIALAVDDDGVGFAQQPLLNDPADARLGVVGMTERAQLLGGQLEIISVLNQGTHLRAMVPMKAREQASIVNAAASG
jgi:signal transduction histidine kinase